MFKIIKNQATPFPTHNYCIRQEKSLEKVWTQWAILECAYHQSGNRDKSEEVPVTLDYQFVEQHFNWFRDYHHLFLCVCDLSWNCLGRCKCTRKFIDHGNYLTMIKRGQGANRGMKKKKEWKSWIGTTCSHNSAECIQAFYRPSHHN